MIISHKNKFIFIHVKKTAGTYVSIVLSSVCEDGDIIAPFNDEDTALLKKYSGVNSSNYHIKIYRYRLKDFYRKFLLNKEIIFKHHMPAYLVKKYVGNRIWNNYFKFCFEREPICKVLSYLRWREKISTEQILDSNRLINKDLLLKLKSGGYNLYTINGNVAVDKIYKYENLENALIEISNKYNIDISRMSFKAKKTLSGNLEMDLILKNMDISHIRLILDIFSWEYKNIYPNEYEHIIDILSKRRFF